MILFIHVVLLTYTAYKLMSFDRSDRKYRVFMSFLAYLWTAGSLMAALTIVVYYPDYVERLNLLTLLLAGVSALAAWWCQGNVSELFRKLTRNKIA